MSQSEANDKKEGENPGMIEKVCLKFVELGDPTQQEEHFDVLPEGENEESKNPDDGKQEEGDHDNAEQAQEINELDQACEQ